MSEIKDEMSDVLLESRREYLLATLNQAFERAMTYLTNPPPFQRPPALGDHNSTSCGAAVIVKPNARLCERWVTHENLSRAAEQRLTHYDRKAQIMEEFYRRSATPKL
jgi:hypothetical protein